MKIISKIYIKFRLVISLLGYFFNNIKDVNNFNSFEFIDINVWCKKVYSKKEFINSLNKSNTWLQLSKDKIVQLKKPNFYKSERVLKDNFYTADTNGFKLSDLIKSKNFIKGAVLANLKNVKIIDNSLIVLVNKNLSITEGYGSKNWADFQINKWPESHNFFKSFVKLSNNQFFFTRLKLYKNQKKIKKINFPVIYFSNREDNQVYHWTFENLPRLMCLDLIPELKNYPILVRESLSRFQSETLRFLNIKNKIIISNGFDLEVSNLIFPSISSPPVLDYETIFWLRKKMLLNFKNKKIKKSRIFISRKDTNHRRIINEDDISKRLSLFGFETLTLSRLTLKEQIESFRSAEIVIMPHGAAGTHMIYAPKNSVLIEIQSPTQINTAIFSITQVLKQKYGFIIGDKPINSSSINNDYYVNENELISILKKVTNKNLENIK
jgi:hypothetical protein